jgi:hypothetical protein
VVSGDARPEVHCGDQPAPPASAESDAVLDLTPLYGSMRFRASQSQIARFGPIGMEQLWNRGGATGGKRSAH